ncbi:uncharacterized protein BDV17DRAFT_273123 [Aspergillus undulatus]|uniref:uncharacterized protein n=1 Tax=Aspergillus undulatus TaxID=1810928 RepID=UPI003CCD047E
MPPLEELSIETCCVTREPRLAQVRGLLGESEVGQVQRIFDTSSTSLGLIEEIKQSSRLVTQLKKYGVSFFNGELAAVII